MSRIRFSYLAWALLLYNLPVVLWGAFVRASRSGDGCGDHWPSCGGELVPTDVQHSKTWIEYSHRASTMIYGLMAVVLVIWAWRAYPKGHVLRKSTFAILVFTIIEGLIGRYLVVHQLVVMNSSFERAVWMALHLANIFSLLSACVLTAWWSVGGARFQWRDNARLGWMWGACLLGIIVVAVTGAMAALGDMLYPSSTLLEGIRQDFARDAALILKTRPLHPLTATLVSLLAAWTIVTTIRLRPNLWVQKLGPIVLAVLLGQYIFGFLNLLMMAPIWMQLTHLLLANLLWIGLVFLAVASLSEQTQEDRVLEPIENEKEVRGWSNLPLAS